MSGIPLGAIVQEGQRAIGDRQRADADVVRELIAEIGLQFRAVRALRLGEDLDTGRGVLESRDDAEAVLAHRQRGLIGIGLRGAGYLLAAACDGQQQADRQYQRRPGYPHVNRPSLCARYSIRDRGHQFTGTRFLRVVSLHGNLVDSRRWDVLACALQSSQSHSSRMSTASPTRCFG